MFTRFMRRLLTHRNFYSFGHCDPEPSSGYGHCTPAPRTGYGHCY